MATVTRKPSSAALRARRAAAALRRRAEDKADYAAAVKACAKIDAGQVKVLTRDEFLREMGLRG